MNKILLISIKPQYVKEILNGNKEIELRKSIPKEVGLSDYILIYSTYPEMALVALCRIKEIIIDSPNNIWKNYSSKLGISFDEYNQYYANNSRAVGIEIHDLEPFDKKISLKQIRRITPNFSPPQTYKYLSKEIVCNLLMKSTL